MCSHYRVYNLGGSKGDVWRMVSYLKLSFVKKYTVSYRNHHHIIHCLWWKNVELGSNVIFAIDGRPMAPDLEYSTLSTAVFPQI
jgi:hypothetical protein